MWASSGLGDAWSWRVRVRLPLSAAHPPDAKAPHIRAELTVTLAETLLVWGQKEQPHQLVSLRCQDIHRALQPCRGQGDGGIRGGPRVELGSVPHPGAMPRLTR